MKFGPNLPVPTKSQKEGVGVRTKCVPKGKPQDESLNLG